MSIYDSFDSGNKEKGKQEGKFIDRKLFVPLDIRDSSLHVNRGKKLDTVVTVTMVLIGIAIFIFIMTFKGFKDITGFSFIAVIIIYILFFFTVIYFISSKFIFKIDDRRFRYI